MKSLLFLLSKVFLKVWSFSVKTSRIDRREGSDPCSDMSFSIYLLGLARRHAGHAVVGAAVFCFSLAISQRRLQDRRIACRLLAIRWLLNAHKRRRVATLVELFVIVLV
jgi:hypothetical protein